MKIHEANGKTFILWAVPEGGNRFKIFNDERPYLSYFRYDGTPREYLPEGKWQILGLANELSEEQAHDLVEYIPERFQYLDYHNESHISYYIDTAIESLSSLCQSLGMDMGMTLIIAKL